MIHGANIGTTTIGWRVAAVGFEIKLELFALPIIGGGVVMRLIGGTRRMAEQSTKGAHHLHRLAEITQPPESNAAPHPERETTSGDANHNGVSSRQSALPTGAIHNAHRKSRN